MSSTDVVTVTYMVPGMNPLQNTVGINAEAFTDVSVSNLTPPVVPAGSVMASSPDPGELEVSWTAPADISRVRIYQVQYFDGRNWLACAPCKGDTTG